ncbi:hypothetical protein O7A70_32880 [Mesorhizobium sp. Cs1299R1N1]
MAVTPGTGKSHIAKAIAYQEVQYLGTDDFFHRHALNALAQREARMLTIIDCDLLVLDDLFLARARQFIGSTTTTTALEVRCCLDENEYPKAIIL